jgi:quercetin dioxygenase-like cupin family protein
MSEMTEEKYFVSEMDGLIDEVPADSILSRTYFEQKGFKAIQFGFAPGQELSEHTASVPAVIHFLEGEAKLVLGEDEKREAKQGTWAYMPPNLPHSIKAETKVVMLLYLLG